MGVGEKGGTGKGGDECWVVTKCMWEHGCTTVQPAAATTGIGIDLSGGNIYLTS